MKVEYTLNNEQYKEILGLAYWIADLHYIRERHGADDPECEVCRKTIDFIFTELDRLNVPFWVQNTVICWAENWRNYADNHTIDFLKTRNIFVA